MAATNQELANVLNDLIEINNDRIGGYEKAIKETDDPDLKALFIDMASRSHQFKNELSTELRRLGETPTEGTRNSGKIFRLWMDIKAALTGKDREAILGSCERGEDAALDAYDDGLNSDEALPSNIRQMIEQQKQRLLQDHNRIKALRDSVHV